MPRPVKPRRGPGCVAKEVIIAYSWQEQIKPAGTQDIQCDIEYLDKSYIHVYLDGTETTRYTWTSATNIRLNTALAASTTVLLIRKTEREYLYIEFASGSPFIEVNVDSQNTQFLHLAQELVEGRAIPGFYGDISMNGYRITSVGDPTNPQDAATKNYVDVGDDRLDALIDTERAARKAADDGLGMRVTLLEQGINTDDVTIPWWTVTTVPTNTISPPYQFTRATLYLNGVHQSIGYGFSIVNNQIILAETIPAGTVVSVRIGQDSTDLDAVSQSEFDDLKEYVYNMDLGEI